MLKTRRENLYKTCLKLMIFEQKVKIGLQNHHFPNGTFEFLHTQTRKVEKPYKLNEKHGFSKVIFTCAKPYKTCLKLMKIEQKSQIGLQNYLKSNRFIDKTHMAFRHVEKPYKTCRKHRKFGGLEAWRP